MNNLEIVLAATTVVFFLTSVLGIGYGILNRIRVQRLNDNIADLARHLEESSESALNWLLYAVMLLREVDYRQQKLKNVHQDLRAEAYARKSQAVHLDFQERRGKRLFEMVQEVRVALAQERSSRAREKLWLEFLLKVAHLAKGSLQPV